MNLKRGVKNIVYSIVGQAITLVIGLFIPRLVIVNYSSEVNGLLNSVSQVLIYLSLLEAGVGAASLQALYKPIADNSHESINSIVAATGRYYRRTGLFYFLFVLGISFIYPLIVTSSLDYWFVFIIIFISGVPNLINYFFQGKIKILINAYGYNYVLTNLTTVTGCLSSGLKIGLLLLNVNIILVQTIYCFISLVQMIFIYIYVKRKFPWLSTSVKPDYKAIKKKNDALIHQVCGLITNCTDITILSIFCDLYVVSIYTVYNMVFNLINSVADSVNNGLQYYFGQTYYGDNVKYRKVIDAYETYYVGICSAFMLAFCWLILPFLKLYTAGADISYINEWLPILFVAIGVLRSYRNAALNTISVAGYFKETRHHAIIESVLNLGISIVAVIWLGIEGVLIGTIISLLYRDFVSIRFSNRKILQRSSRHSLKIIFIDLPIFAVAVVAMRFVTLNITGYLEFFGVAAAIGLACLILYLTVNSLANPSEFKLVKSVVKRKLFRRAKGETR